VEDDINFYTEALAFIYEIHRVCQRSDGWMDKTTSGKEFSSSKVNKSVDSKCYAPELLNKKTKDEIRKAVLSRKINLPSITADSTTIILTDEFDTFLRRFFSKCLDKESILSLRSASTIALILDDRELQGKVKCRSSSEAVHQSNLLLNMSIL
jgi:hypothetical protein